MGLSLQTKYEDTCFVKKVDHSNLVGVDGLCNVLGKLPLPGCPADLDKSKAMACCACSRCSWGVVWTFFLSSIISHFFLPLSGRRPDIDDNIVSKGRYTKNNQPTTVI